MTGKHRRVAEVPFDEVREAATSLGYPVNSVVLEHPGPLDDPEPIEAPTAGEGAAVESAPVLPLPAGSRRTRLETRRSQARRNRLIAAGAVVGLLIAGIGWTVLRGGSDKPSADAAAAPGRSQTTLLLQVVDNHHRALVSSLLAHDGTAGGSGFAALIPSTLEVSVAGVGNASLAETSTYSGTNASALAVSDALGVLVDGTWTISAEALARLVDAAGGVQVTVDRDVLRAGSGGAGATVLITAGSQKLGGAMAATYATYLAEGEPEANRLARFGDVFREVLAGLPADASQLAATVGGLGGGSAATMTLDRVASLLEGLRSDAAAKSLIVQNLPTRSLDGGGSGSAQVVDPSAEAMISSGFSGSRPAKRANGDVRVLVQNGVGTPGLGEFARTALVKNTLSYVNGGNARTFGYQTSLILITDASPAAREQGSAVAKSLGLPESDIQIAATGQSLADVIVVLGADFQP